MFSSGHLAKKKRRKICFVINGEKQVLGSLQIYIINRREQSRRSNQTPISTLLRSTMLFQNQNHYLRACKSKGKKSVKSQTDRFDELPDDILSSIVSYFSVRDAAYVSLLSSRWRHLCASISKLDFTWNSMFRTHIDCHCGNDDDCDDCGRHPCQDFKNRFVRGVNQFLQNYEDDSRLVIFRVGFCLHRDSSSDIDQWVRFAVSRGVEQLYLSLSCGRITKDNLYTLRSELLTHPNNLCNIRVLLLSSCVLGPGVIDHFGFLKDLTLINTRVGREEIESIHSCCLNLESFRLGSCELPSKLCISGSFQRLKFMAVNLCDGLEEIEFSATSLTSFEYEGLFIKFNFSRAPNLEKVHFNTDDDEIMQYLFSQLAKDLPLVKTLSVHTETIWVKRLPMEMATFSNVKLLELFCHQTMTLDILRLIVGLRACPLLEKLYLAVKCRVHFEQRMQVLTEFGNKHLKEVHIGGFYYSKSFIHFAIYLLKYATELEKMVINRQPRFYNGVNRWYFYKFPWDKGEHQKVCERLQGRFKSAVIVVP